MKKIRSKKDAPRVFARSYFCQTLYDNSMFMSENWPFLGNILPESCRWLNANKVIPKIEIPSDLHPNQCLLLHLGEARNFHRFRCNYLETLFHTCIRDFLQYLSFCSSEYSKKVTNPFQHLILSPFKVWWYS